MADNADLSAQILQQMMSAGIMSVADGYAVFGLCRVCGLWEGEHTDACLVPLAEACAEATLDGSGHGR